MKQGVDFYFKRDNSEGFKPEDFKVDSEIKKDLSFSQCELKLIRGWYLIFVKPYEGDLDKEIYRKIESYLGDK